jgi:hypothetical protein
MFSVASLRTTQVVCVSIDVYSDSYSDFLY